MTKRAAKSGLLVWLMETSQPMYLVDVKRRIRFFNHGSEKLFGVTAGDVLGKRTPFAAGLTMSDEFSTGNESLEKLLSRLSPPPECFTSGDIATLPLDAGSTVIQFLPLRDPSGQIETVLCFITPTAHQQSAGEIANYWHRFLAQELAKEPASTIHLVGRSPLWQKVKRQADVAARTRCPAFISGPVGTGKSALARFIVQSSPDRASREVISFDTKAIAVTAFTNHIKTILERQQQGEFKNGIILLDDIEGVPRDVQLKLSELATHGTWLIATSRQGLDALRLQNLLTPEFDLLISSLVIELPTLRERGPEDLALLMQMFIAEQNLTVEKQVSGWTEEFLLEMIEYQWPANLAELRDVVGQAHQQARETKLTLADLPFRFRMGKDAQQLRVEQASQDKPFEPLDLEKHLEQVERRLIEQAIVAAGGNKTLAAQSLGMTRAKFYRRLEQLGVMEGHG
ncbi:transcriptional regulator [Lacunimicrobium album]